MDLLTILLLLLLVTRLCAELAARIDQPPLVGELIGGVLIGVLINQFGRDLPFLATLTEDEGFHAITELGIFFLMLLAGMELRIKDLTSTTARSAPIALLGMAVPLVGGFALGWFYLPESDLHAGQSLFLGVALAITAVPVAIKILIDLDLLHTDMGKTIVSAAVIDDILSLVLLAGLTAFLSSQSDAAFGPAMQLQIIGKVVLFFGIAWIVRHFVYPPLTTWVARFELERANFSLIVVMALCLSVLAEALNMHFLIGAFTAGMLFTHDNLGEKRYKTLQDQVEAITLGVLAPLFFASIGLRLDLSALTMAPVLLLLVLLTATAAKFLGAGLTARLCGFNGREALSIGSAMNARGSVEIIIADIALQAGLFEVPEGSTSPVQHLFSAVVIMAILTTLASPILLRMLWSESKPATE